MPKSFTSGEVIPRSGIYRVSHAPHRLPPEVTLVKGQLFPTCSRCSQPVEFHAVHIAPSGDEERRGKVVLYNLPVIEEAKPRAKRAKRGG